jgi:transcriptional regulator with XRE-family HTH domain/TolA-binding protein
VQNVGVPEDLAELLAAVEPAELGARLKQARLLAGLTQTQLADGEASVGYVSRIESGQRRPELSLLLKLAARVQASPLALLTGAPDPTLMRLQVALDHAELTLRGGSPDSALAQLEELSAELESAPVAGTALGRRARLARATAHEALGHLDEAILTLEDLLADGADRSGDSVVAAVALCRCYRESGDLARAVETGERELESLQQLGLEGSDEAVQLTVTVAAAHFLRGDVAHAARLCRRAIERAEELGTPVAKASAYWNASIVESERGAVAAAVPLAAKALRLLEDAEDNRNLARLRSELGILQLRLDPPEVDEARANLEAADTMLTWSSASQVDVARNRLNLARAQLLSGDVDGAREAGRAVLEQLPEGVAILGTEVRLFLGEAAVRAGDDSDAAQQHAAAFAALEEMGQHRPAAELWFRLAASLDEAGSVQGALDAYRWAAACSGVARSRARTDA